MGWVVIPCGFRVLCFFFFIFLVYFRILILSKLGLIFGGKKRKKHLIIFNVVFLTVCGIHMLLMSLTKILFIFHDVKYLKVF